MVVRTNKGRERSMESDWSGFLQSWDQDWEDVVWKVGSLGVDVLELASKRRNVGVRDCQLVLDELALLWVLEFVDCAEHGLASICDSHLCLVEKKKMVYVDHVTFRCQVRGNNSARRYCAVV